MTTKINSSTKFQGKTVIQLEPPVYNDYGSVYAVFFPSTRFPGGVGGQTWRILERRSGTADGKPIYGYGDEVIQWNLTFHRWEMNNAYQGLISYSPENVSYPWQAQHWYYGSNVLDPEVSATRV